MSWLDMLAVCAEYADVKLDAAETRGMPDLLCFCPVLVDRVAYLKFIDWEA